MSRVRRGFKLAGTSWQVIVAEPAILLVLVVGLVGMVLVSGGAVPVAVPPVPDRRRLPVPELPGRAAGPVVGSIVSSYCNVVVAVMADRRLRGLDPTVEEGMAVATSKLNRIFSWTLVSIAVGLLLQVIAERFRLAGAITSRTVRGGVEPRDDVRRAGAALEDLSVRDSIRRSSSIFKSKWGESVVAEGTVGLAVMLAAFPAMFAVALLAAVSVPVAIAAAVLLFGSLMLVSGALDVGRRRRAVPVRDGRHRPRHASPPKTSTTLPPQERLTPPSRPPAAFPPVPHIDVFPDRIRWLGHHRTGWARFRDA